MVQSRQSETKKTKMPNRATSRPTGVTIIAILGFISAIISILGGIALLAFGGLIEAFASTGGLVGGFLGIAGGLLLIFGLILLYGFYKLLKMSRTGWTIVMILEILTLILAAVLFDWLGLILALIIVIYLAVKRSLFR